MSASWEVNCPPIWMFSWPLTVDSDIPEESRSETRTIRRIRLAVIVAALAVSGVAYALSESFRQEADRAFADRAFGILARGDIAALRGNAMRP